MTLPLQQCSSLYPLWQAPSQEAAGFWVLKATKGVACTKCCPFSHLWPNTSSYILHLTLVIAIALWQLSPLVGIGKAVEQTCPCGEETCLQFHGPLPSSWGKVAYGIASPSAEENQDKLVYSLWPSSPPRKSHICGSLLITKQIVGKAGIPQKISPQEFCFWSRIKNK